MGRMTPEREAELRAEDFGHIQDGGAISDLLAEVDALRADLTARQAAFDAVKADLDGMGHILTSSASRFLEIERLNEAAKVAKSELEAMQRRANQAWAEAADTRKELDAARTEHAEVVEALDRLTEAGLSLVRQCVDESHSSGCPTCTAVIDENGRVERHEAFCPFGNLAETLAEIGAKTPSVLVHRRIWLAGAAHEHTRLMEVISSFSPEVTEPDGVLRDVLRLLFRRERADGLEEAAKICDDYGHEGDRDSREYAAETAEELAARFRTLAAKRREGLGSPAEETTDPPRHIECRNCEAKIWSSDGSKVDYKGSGFCKCCGTVTYRLVCNACLPLVLAAWDALRSAAPRKTAADKPD
jgi:hypothetical protein